MAQKILLVFGTRPEAIKMAPLVKELQMQPDRFQTVVCVTGQHREMLDQVLDVFGITPDFDLNIMKPGQDLYDVTCRVLTGMRDVLKEVQPGMVMVHGDTTTSQQRLWLHFISKSPLGMSRQGYVHKIFTARGPKK
jgi:UDP-N-acetylglucosamine 2-epimerase (non-hydrolysing)